MIYGVDGQYGSGKTSFLVWLALNEYSGSTVFTNIKLDTVAVPNVYEFAGDYETLLDVFRTVNLVNDLERFAFSTPRENSSLPIHPRDDFTRFVIFFDESTSNMNANDWKQFDSVITQYLHQNRKLFLDFYLAGADGSGNASVFRKQIEWWYYMTPFSVFPLLRDFKVVRKQKREDDGRKVRMEPYIALDAQNDYVVKEKPIDEYVGWFWQPKLWRYYDDLAKVINDPLKYEIEDLDRVSKIFHANPYLARVVKKKPQFSWLKNTLDIEALAKLDPESKDVFGTPLVDDSVDVYVDEDILLPEKKIDVNPLFPATSQTGL